MSTVNHQCHKCLTTVWIQELDDGEEGWRGAADADCSCNSGEQDNAGWSDDE